MKYKHLTSIQMYEISAYLKCGKPQNYIAEQLGVSESCISKELKRNRLKRGGYNAQKAIENTKIRKERFNKIGFHKACRGLCKREIRTRTMVTRADSGILQK